MSFDHAALLEHCRRTVVVVAKGYNATIQEHDLDDLASDTYMAILTASSEAKAKFKGKIEKLVSLKAKDCYRAFCKAIEQQSERFASLDELDPSRDVPEEHNSTDRDVKHLPAYMLRIIQEGELAVGTPESARILCRTAIAASRGFDHAETQELLEISKGDYYRKRQRIAKHLWLFDPALDDNTLMGCKIARKEG